MRNPETTSQTRTSIFCARRFFGRARGEERQQLKWLAYSVGLLSGVAVVGFLNFQVLDNPLPVFEGVGAVLGVVAIAAVPVAIGVAILRYGLY